MRERLATVARTVFSSMRKEKEKKRGEGWRKEAIEALPPGKGEWNGGLVGHEVL